MTKTAFVYYSKSKEAYILTKVLHKAPKGAYKRDLIHLEFVSDIDKVRRGVVMTPEEAIITANALLCAVVVYNNKK